MMSNSKQTRYGVRTKTQSSTIKFTVKKSSPGLLTGRKSRSLKQDCIVIESLTTQLKSPRKRLQESEVVSASNSELSSPKKRPKGNEEATAESNLDVSPSKRSRSRSSKRYNEADSTPTKSRTPKKLFADENDNTENTPKKKLLDDENEKDCSEDFPKQRSAKTASFRKSARIAQRLDEIDSKSKEASESPEEPLAVELEQDKVTSTTHSTLGDEVDEVFSALNRNIPDELPGRDHLSQQLYDIIVNSFEKKESKSIYISGSPGSGKTVTTKILLSRPNIKRKYNVIYVNCMKLGIKETIFTVIANKAKKRDEKLVKNATIDDVQELLSNKSKPYLLVLDEIDEINTKDPTDLYAVFRLTSTLPKGKIVLIGIGNTLNFITKHLPFLHFKNCKPITVQFPSYSEHQIIDIIKNRLKNVKFERLKFPESAIELLARKVASFGGDARAAIGVACASVRDVLKNADLDSSEGEYTVDLFTVKTVVDAMYDTVERFRKEKKTVNSSCQIDTFPLQQKLILCSLLLVIEKNICPLGELTIDRIRDMYKEMCESEKYEVLIHKEFLNACKLIESYQIFSIVNKSGKGKKRNVDKVMLKWDVDEMTKALSKERLFGSILSSRL